MLMNMLMATPGYYMDHQHKFEKEHCKDPLYDCTVMAIGAPCDGFFQLYLVLIEHVADGTSNLPRSHIGVTCACE